MGRSSAELIYWVGYLNNEPLFHTRTWTKDQAVDQLKIKLHHWGLDSDIAKYFDIREGKL